MAGCEQHVAERAVPVELEAARRPARDPLDADDAEALAPSRCGRAARATCARKSSTVGW